MRQPGTKPSATSQGADATLPKRTAIAGSANARAVASSQSGRIVQSSPVMATRSASVWAAPWFSAALRPRRAIGR
jgi:hypothetical protein